MSVLVVSEKPSVARSLAAVLGAGQKNDGYLEGNGYIVSWCLGHLLELEHAGAYDEKYRKWRYADLPIIPAQWKRAAVRDKARQLEILRGLMNRENVEVIVNACDAGREGELIFRLVYEYCKADRPVKRFWASSLEDGAIRAGMENMRDGAEYDDLYAAALCREKADWTMGVNATRLFSVLYGATLGIGRVQSPTLSMLAEREAAIALFEPKPFYIPQITAEGFTAAGGRLADRDAAEAVRAACDGMDAVVLSVETKEKSVSPPRLYDLTSLQRDSNRFYGYTAKETLDYAQAIYEKKLITYPRTDSRYLTEDMAAGLENLVNLSAMRMGSSLVKVPLTADGGAVTDSAKVTDHHAIIPTNSISKTDWPSLPTGERDVLNMVIARLICATAPAHVYEAVTATMECAGHSFTAKGKTTLENGWKTIDAAFRALLREAPEDEDGAEDGVLPAMDEGRVFASVSASVHEGKTAPPKHHTEDTLLAAMESAGAEDVTEDIERRGIGTPATRAAVIEKLVKSGFVERKKKNLIPTERGVNLCNVLPDMIKSPALTAEWENTLARIARGESSPEEFIDGINELTREMVRLNSQPNPAYANAFADESKTGNALTGNCPRCGAPVRENAKGFFCDDRACGFRLWKDNRFFTSKGKTLDAQTAAALLKDGRVSMTGLVSQKTGKQYDADIVIEDTGVYTNFKLDFDNGRERR